MTNSRLLDGWVRHARTRPRENRFRYRIWHLLLDVDELDHLDRTLPGFGHNRPAPIALYDRDHFGDAPLPLREKVARWVAGQGRELPAGPLLFTAYPRVLGYTFNPVCWWFAHDLDGELAMVIAEVRNTFGDWYPYLLDDLEGDATKLSERPKNFHVSPFLPIEGLDYTFKVRAPHVGAAPGDRLAVHMDVDDADGHVFDATQAQRTVALTGRNLLWWNLRHPLMTFRTMFLIHAQALKLWWKRTPFHRRPEPPDTGLDAIVAADAPDTGTTRANVS